MKRRPVRVAATIAIVGTGLIGSSIGLAVRAASPQTNVVGFDRSVAATRASRRRGALTAVAPSLVRAVQGAGLIVLAMPEPAVVALLPRVFADAPPHCLVMDVAGLKTRVLATAARLLAGRPGLGFIGGHPLAGVEASGAGAALATLFQGRAFALCAPPQARRARYLATAKRFVRRLGAIPVSIGAGEHDRIVAATSALPQVAASAVMLAAGAHLAGCRQLTGPGFESVTRLAASPASLWASNLVANKRHVVPTLAALEGKVREFRAAIEREDEAKVAGLLHGASRAQRQLKARGVGD